MKDSNVSLKNITTVTLGCRLNQADTAIIFEEFKKNGFNIAKYQDTGIEYAYIIINTCSVTGSASQKSRQTVHSIRKAHPESCIIVTGCSIETDSNWKTEKAVDLLIPNKDKTKIIDYIQGNLTEKKIKEPTIFTENSIGYYPFKTRANIKIQEGCDAFCTYCIVPYGRGKPRSREWNNTIDEFKHLVNKGYKEIILTGVNIAAYNCNGKNLLDLLEKLISIEGNFRIRLSSTEPQFSMKGLIDIIASSKKICKFLHIPVQHCSNDILKRMGRNYEREAFKNFVIEAVSKISDICIGSDIIVGFPGEEDFHFEDCSNFIKELPLAYLHVFKFSKRLGTPAYNYPNQIPAKIAANRHKIMSEISTQLSHRFMHKQISKCVDVLYEEKKDNYIVGFSDNYIKVYTATKENILNKIVPTQLVKIYKNRAMIGTL